MNGRTFEAILMLRRLGMSIGRPSWLRSAHRSRGTHHIPGPGKMCFMAFASAWSASSLPP
eukprot:13057714-Alexandrium_andersonii.AAC.1